MTVEESKLALLAEAEQLKMPSWREWMARHPQGAVALAAAAGLAMVFFPRFRKFAIGFAVGALRNRIT